MVVYRSDMLDYAAFQLLGTMMLLGGTLTDSEFVRVVPTRYIVVCRGATSDLAPNIAVDAVTLIR